MGLPNEVVTALIGAANQGGYEIEQSLRFNSGDSTYLNRTPGSAGDRRTWTWSGWVKRSETGDHVLFFGGPSDSTLTRIRFLSDEFTVQSPDSGSYNINLHTSAVYRDFSAWMHCVVSVDTTQATSSDRVKIYINGSQVTEFDTETYPSQNYDTHISTANKHSIGAEDSSAIYDAYNGYLAEVYFIDGSALDPTDFGKYNSNGVWIPIQSSLTEAIRYSASGYEAIFDGDTGNGVVIGTSYVTVASGLDITAASTIGFNDNGGSQLKSMRINGTTELTVTGGSGWQDFSFTGTINTIELKYNGTTLYTGIRVDGTTLVDNYGDYGQNGFYLKFDSSATNGIGHDHSGNRNNWTANNFTTSSTGTDVMSDTPTKNWCTLNPLDSEQNLSEGNLTCGSSNSHEATRATFGMTTGKWYWEGDAGSGWTNDPAIGIMTPNAVLSDQLDATGGRWFRFDGNRWYDGTNGGSYGTAVSSGSASVIGMAYDGDNGNLVVYVDGVSQGTAFSGLKSGQTPNLGSSTSDTWFPATKTYDGSFNINFGQREFLYPPGTYSATSYFNTVLYSGNNSTNAITGVGFQPDLVWIKPRNLADHHRLTDVIRGANRSVNSNESVAEYGPTNSYLDSFDSDGFTVSGSDGGWNNNSYDYVAWCWKAGGTPSSNTDGSITASVSANQTAGFSIVTYTGTGSNATVGHGLGVAPELMFIKSRSNATEWIAYHSGIGPTKFMNLDGNGAESTNSSVFNDTAPTSTTFTVGTVDAINYSDYTYVAYCFAEKAGISKFGTYTGNGSVDGPLINDLGFAPALLVIKRTGAASEWAVYDSARGNDNQLRWDAIDVDNTNSAVNVRLTSSGFKIATSDPAQNSNGDTYLYMAWARNYSADDTYKALNTANLPAPEIKDGSKYFQNVLWSGDGATSRDITTNFSPDFAIIKQRDDIYGFGTYDIVRGGGKFLRTDGTDTETTNPADGYVSAFNSTSVTLAKGTYGWNVNGSGYTYVGWFWEGGGSGSSNTDGSITSTVSVNQTAGFSVVTYTGNNTVGATWGHGLGVAPDMVIIKHRDSTYNWVVYHTGLDATAPEDYYISINDTGERAGSTTIFDSTAPTSTTFTVGDLGQVNASSQPYVAYCFSEVEGYSKFGTYVGNDSTNGPFVYTGFKPAWVMVKSYSSGHTYNWVIIDAARDPYNVMYKQLFPNNATSESTGVSTVVDFLSNGFKWRYGSNGFNGPSVSYIFAAFAENPFGGSGASPATAR